LLEDIEQRTQRGFGRIQTCVIEKASGSIVSRVDEGAVASVAEANGYGLADKGDDHQSHDIHG
jgi:hypothetical protein